MNLFNKIPDNFFSILSSRNKNIYGLALVTLYDALILYHNRIRKSSMYLIFIYIKFDFISLIQLLQMFFSLNSQMFSVPPQKWHTGAYFVRIILSPSEEISTGSFADIPSFLRSSLGTTIRPSSSMCLTIPVDFIWSAPFIMFDKNILPYYGMKVNNVYKKGIAYEKTCWKISCGNDS